MPTTLRLVVPPEVAAVDAHLRHAIARELGVLIADIKGYQRLRQSLDARGRQVRVVLTLQVFVNEQPQPRQFESYAYRNVSNADPVLIVGYGPAGMFAALRLLELGLKPIVLERGQDVRTRRRHLAAISKTGLVNPESNYCFGEGGAGTYSDGKLYTRSSKRGNIQRILEQLHLHGAGDEILYEAHPHIGTNKLPAIVQAITATIVAHGGQVHFGQRVDDIMYDSMGFRGVRLQDGSELQARACLLATGHSARDIYTLLHQKNILLQAKPFALGVRIEHPQALIDRIQYHCDVRDPYLPAAAYTLTTQSQGRGVFSFCMCPGGIIAPAATAPGEVVVNGWSPSKRNNPYANSGLVASVDENDFAPHAAQGVLAGMHYQASIEQQAYAMGGGNLRAPAQRLTDFIAGRASTTLPPTSYMPGTTATNLHELLPSPLAAALREGLQHFGRSMRGYITEEAVLLGVESRTSSPLRIPRDSTTLMHLQVTGLFPCAEGAGYAGGIVSAAMDGQRSAEAITQFLQH